MIYYTNFIIVAEFIIDVKFLNHRILRHSVPEFYFLLIFFLLIQGDSILTQNLEY